MAGWTGNDKLPVQTIPKNQIDKPAQSKTLKFGRLAEFVQFSMFTIIYYAAVVCVLIVIFSLFGARLAYFPEPSSLSRNENQTQAKSRKRNMLVLTRKLGEKICIDGGIELEVLEISGSRIRLGISAPKDRRVERAERVFDRIGTDGIPSSEPVALGAAGLASSMNRSLEAIGTRTDLPVRSNAAAS